HLPRSPVACRQRDGTAVGNCAAHARPAPRRRTGDRRGAPCSCCRAWLVCRADLCLGASASGKHHQWGPPLGGPCDVKITVLDSSDAVADALAERVASMLRMKPAAVLGLASGRTPVNGYAELRRMHAAGKTDWSHASTFNLDEFAGVDSSHPGSFRTFMQRHLFDGVNVQPQRIHFL